MMGHANRSKAVKGDPYENLANAIILQAVSDYRAALRRYRRHGRPDRELEDCERFFRSQWFGCLTGVDGEYLIRKIREEAGV
jgi:hypothetical protein